MTSNLSNQIKNSVPFDDEKQRERDRQDRKRRREESPYAKERVDYERRDSSRDYIRSDNHRSDYLREERQRTEQRGDYHHRSEKRRSPITTRLEHEYSAQVRNEQERRQDGDGYHRSTERNRYRRSRSRSRSHSPRNGRRESTSQEKEKRTIEPKRSTNFSSNPQNTSNSRRANPEERRRDFDRVAERSKGEGNS